MNDKLAIGFFAEILYIKGIICFDELQDILDVTNPSELNTIIDKMLTEQYNTSKRGEAYVGYNK